jgi:lysine-N-methylase
MPLPVRHLPVLQNWDCHECGQCCKEYAIFVTPGERARIEAQGWAGRPDFAGIPLFVRDGLLSDQWRLNHRADGGCIFLDPTGRCRIHAEFGGTQKPLACQVYPYVLIPAGDHWRVGVRYACPSASGNLGRPVTRQATEIASFAMQLEDREGVRRRSLKPPRLAGRQRIPWDDLVRIATRLSRDVMADTRRPLADRWRHVLQFLAVGRSSDFSRIAGPRVDEFMRLVIPATATLPTDVPSPSGLGRLLFRLTAALYCRRDTGAKRGRYQTNRWRLFRAAARFARGTGPIPPLHAMIPEVTFEAMETPAGPIPTASDELLTRYYRTKLESLQFTGPIHYHASFWLGLESLALTLPVTLWLSRAFAGRPRESAIELALQIVDDNFGYNPLLGSFRQKWATRTLAARGELSRLIAWYDR